MHTSKHNHSFNLHNQYLSLPGAFSDDHNSKKYACLNGGGGGELTSWAVDVLHEMILEVSGARSKELKPFSLKKDRIAILNCYPYNACDVKLSTFIFFN